MCLGSSGHPPLIFFQLGVLERTCTCFLPPNSQLTPGGNGQPLALIPADLPGQNPRGAIWPLSLLQILDPSREGCIARRGQGPPAAGCCGTSSSVPWTFCGDPNSGSGHGCPASLGLWSGSAALFLHSKVATVVRALQWASLTCQ